MDFFTKMEISPGMIFLFLWIISMAISYWGFRLLILKDIRKNGYNWAMSRGMALILTILPGFNVLSMVIFWLLELDWDNILDKIFMLKDD